MDRNSIIGLLVIFALLIGFSMYMQPSKKELEARQHQADSIAVVQKKIEDSLLKNQRKVVATPAASDTGQTKTEGIPDTLKGKALLRDKLGIFANSAKGKDQIYYIENEVLKIGVSSKGGRIKEVQLKQYKTFDGLPLMLFKGDSSLFGFTFFANNRSISTQDMYFQPVWNDKRFSGKDSISLSGNDSTVFSMRLYPDLGDSSYNTSKYIEFQYLVRGNDYMIGFRLNFVGMQDIIAANTNYINLDWANNLRQQEKGLENEQNSSTIYYKYYKDEVNYLSERKDKSESLKTRVKWVSFKQQFFTSVLIADNFFLNADIKTQTLSKAPRYLKTMQASLGIPLNLAQNQSVPMSFYFGPNKFSTLRHYKLELEKQIPLGWALFAWINKFAVIPVFNFLGQFNWNYGIIILVLTILLKLVLFPIAYKTYVSSAKMRVLKPEIDDIGKKYPKKEDALKKQQATMALYKRAGVNPMAGCVPMLLQFPILIAMFRFFPASIELRQQKFLWATDLSSYDSILDLGFKIPFYGDHVSLFCLLMTISTIIYTKVNDQMMSSSQQMPGMKLMMYLMPVMFLGFFNNYSSGLSYYYLLANLFTFAQIYIIRRFIDEDKIHAKIQENKNKPVKRSGFQKRLEDMAKKRGYTPR